MISHPIVGSMNALRRAGLNAIPKRAYSTPAFDRESYLAKAKSRLRPGHANPIYDSLSPTPSLLLNTSLAGHIPPEAHHPPYFRRFLPSSTQSQTISEAHPVRAPITNVPLPVGHHLVYFGPQAFPSELMPDGTVADHCPGAPFTRRMWAGGTVRFPKKGGAWGAETTSSLRLAPGHAVCVEKVMGDPVIKGVEGEEKVFVELSRKYSRLWKGERSGEQSIVQRVEESLDIDETRTLVFMRERDVEKVDEPAKEKERDMTRLKRLKDKSWVPTYSFSLTPDRKLLFQFSALTFNAHAIHLDRRYAQEVEGHKDLLVHGPLSLSLMLMAVRAQADKIEAEDGKHVELTELSYRNLAPLYVGEEMKVCVRIREEGELAEGGQRHNWDVWVEGPDGGFAVKGTAEIQVAKQGRRPRKNPGGNRPRWKARREEAPEIARSSRKEAPESARRGGRRKIKAWRREPSIVRARPQSPHMTVLTWDSTFRVARRSGRSH